MITSFNILDGEVRHLKCKYMQIAAISFAAAARISSGRGSKCLQIEIECDSTNDQQRYALDLTAEPRYISLNYFPTIKQLNQSLKCK